LKVKIEINIPIAKLKSNFWHAEKSQNLRICTCGISKFWKLRICSCGRI